MKFFFLCSLTLFFHNSWLHAQPLLWNYDRICQLQVDEGGERLRKIIQTRADSFLMMGPLTVVDKVRHFSDDNHNYESVSIYFWPNPLNPKAPYVARDGVVNPEYKKYDGDKLERLEERLVYLSIQLFLTSDERYYECFRQLLVTWFVDKSTYMNPNFEYAQVMIGHNDNMGAIHGIIDFYFSLNIIESIRLVDYCHGVDRQLMRQLKSWFSRFADWMVNCGRAERIVNLKSNISLAYYVILYNIYAFTVHKSKLTKLGGVINDLINEEIDEQGKQPVELKRTKAFSYSIYNLRHMIDYCILSKNSGIEAYGLIATRFNSAISYLNSFIGNQSAFPYSEISNWRDNELALKYEFSRLYRFCNDDRLLKSYQYEGLNHFKTIYSLLM